MLILICFDTRRIITIVLVILSLCHANPTRMATHGFERICKEAGCVNLPSFRRATPITQADPFMRISSNPSPQCMESHTGKKNQLQMSESALLERRGFSNLIAKGNKFIWKKIEVVLPSKKAYQDMHRFYSEALQRVNLLDDRPASSDVIAFVSYVVITLGTLKLIFENLPPQQAASVEFIKQFLHGMLALVGISEVFGTYRIAAITTNIVVFVTLMWVGNVVGFIG